MKNVKTLLIPVGLMVLVVGIFSFTNPTLGEDEEKCQIKIIKIIDGEKTEVDSTFDCSEQMDWMSSLSGMGDSLHKMIKVMMIDGDSGHFDFKFNVDIDMDEHAVKVMKFNGEEGDEMKFDVQVIDGEGGSMKMIVNGKEIEINMEDLHKRLKELHQDIDVVHHTTGNVIIEMDNDLDGGEKHSVKIIKSMDEDGNVTVKKIVNGEEVEVTEEDLSKMHKGHKMMFISKNGKGHGNHKITVDVDMDIADGKKMKHMVIITKMTRTEKSDEKLATAVEINHKDLNVEDLTFSPNPNEGKFKLNFELTKKQPVHIKIVDLQGKTVYSEKVSDFDGNYAKNIDISENGEGIYILQIIQGKKARTSKVVIK